jgi:hypothetical protein
VSTLLDLDGLQVEKSDAVVEFEVDKQVEGFPADRYLRLHGERIYYLGFGCDTCGLIFKRAGRAASSLSPEDISARLSEGLSQLDANLLAALASVLPPGEYKAALVEITPELVSPGEEGDYFATEQAALFGIDTFTNRPYDPGTKYYRGTSAPIGEDGALFELVVPMIPIDRLDPERVFSYHDRLETGARPTALTLGLVGVYGPAVFVVDRIPDATEHWTLTHFLLDGHHKTLAAAQAGRPLTLLSLIAVAEGVATGDQIDRVLGVLSEAATV